MKYISVWIKKTSLWSNEICTCATMPWFLLVVLGTFMSVVFGVHAMDLPDIHWNSSNPTFNTSNKDHIITVNMYDDIDFVCPHYKPGTAAESDPSMHEYYIIYNVSKQEYENCHIREHTLSRRSKSIVINCSQPESLRPKNYKMVFEKFNPFGSFQFEEGESYYYITTSTGTKEGMSNTHLGACWNNSMKLTITVLPVTTTTTLVDSGHLAIPSLVLYAICSFLHTLYHL